MLVCGLKFISAFEELHQRRRDASLHELLVSSLCSLRWDRQNLERAVSSINQTPAIVFVNAPSTVDG